MSTLKFTYDEIHKIIKNKHEYISTSFKPDLIVAISGGGLIPSRILRTYLDIPIYTVSMHFYNEKHELMENPEIIQWIDNDFSNKRVLIVDEIDDTGTTINYCVKKLKETNRCNEIGAFVIHYKLKKKIFDNDKDTNYFVGQYVPNKWITYPWDNK